MEQGPRRKLLAIGAILDERAARAAFEEFLDAVVQDPLELRPPAAGVQDALMAGRITRVLAGELMTRYAARAGAATAAAPTATR